MATKAKSPEGGGGCDPATGKTDSGSDGGDSSLTADAESGWPNGEEPPEAASFDAKIEAAHKKRVVGMKLAQAFATLLEGAGKYFKSERRACNRVYGKSTVVNIAIPPPSFKPVVLISIPPPSFKPVLLSLSRISFYFKITQTKSFFNAIHIFGHLLPHCFTSI